MDGRPKPSSGASAIGAVEVWDCAAAQPYHNVVGAELPLRPIFAIDPEPDFGDKGR